MRTGAYRTFRDTNGNVITGIISNFYYTSSDDYATWTSYTNLSPDGLGLNHGGIDVDPASPTYGAGFNLLSQTGTGDVVTNGQFLTDASSWSLDTHWTYDAISKAIEFIGPNTSSPPYYFLRQTIQGVQSPDQYRVTFDVIHYISGNVYCSFGGNAAYSFSGNGTKTFTSAVGINSEIYFYGFGVNAQFEITNVTIVPLYDTLLRISYDPWTSWTTFRTIHGWYFLSPGGYGTYKAQANWMPLFT
jgi:hypothetical protein